MACCSYISFLGSMKDKTSLPLFRCSILCDMLWLDFCLYVNRNWKLIGKNVSGRLEKLPDKEEVFFSHDSFLMFIMMVS